MASIFSKIGAAWEDAYDNIRDSVVQIFTDPAHSHFKDYLNIATLGLAPQWGVFSASDLQNPKNILIRQGTVAGATALTVGAPYALSAAGAGLSSLGSLSSLATPAALFAALQKLGQGVPSGIPNVGGLRDALGQIIPSNIFSGIGNGSYDLSNLKIPGNLTDFYKDIPQAVKSILPPGGASLPQAELSNVATPKISSPVASGVGGFNLSLPVIAAGGAGIILLWVLLRKK